MRFFVTLEGPEGGGKSTQAQRLTDHLKNRGQDVLFTREPGGTEIGDQIRRIILSLENKSMSPEAEFLLFSASRAQVVRELIRPHLERGGVVVCDRFYDSSLAYQGFGHELDLALLQTITGFVTGGLVPDLTLLLDLTSELGLERRKQDGRWNRLDDYDLAFHERVRAGYLQLADAEPERWVRIDAAQTEDEIQSQIRAAVDLRITS
ncbi:MAG: dTMP kinase [Chloroflexi bacterium]|nr:dTMP kinase [Chloroflexota bacterium]MCI0827068.1 dTMP kinase [Chloroflexota bacterium]MCI0853892.1 dTMP kinase [Chloroflexota bacterium]MCI0861589.1 dTMP kinase [Chloroflexota bacterium]MCI0876128.1 dTMP kinase [Chloroflexota bacterium]